MKKMVTPLLVLTIIGLFALIFYVKKDATAQAQEFVKGKLTAVNKVLVENKELNQSNSVLWEAAFQTALEKPDRKEFVAIAKKLDTGKDSKFKVSTVNQNSNHWRVNHKWAGFEVKFDSKGNFADIDISQLLGAVE